MIPASRCDECTRAMIIETNGASVCADCERFSCVLCGNVRPWSDGGADRNPGACSECFAYLDSARSRYNAFQDCTRCHVAQHAARVKIRFQGERHDKRARDFVHLVDRIVRYLHGITVMQEQETSTSVLVFYLDREVMDLHDRLIVPPVHFFGGKHRERTEEQCSVSVDQLPLAMDISYSRPASLNWPWLGSVLVRAEVHEIFAIKKNLKIYIERIDGEIDRDMLVTKHPNGKTTLEFQFRRAMTRTEVERAIVQATQHVDAENVKVVRWPGSKAAIEG